MTTAPPHPGSLPLFYQRVICAEGLQDLFVESMRVTKVGYIITTREHGISSFYVSGYQVVLWASIMGSIPMPEDNKEAENLHLRWVDYAKHHFGIEPKNIGHLATELLLPYTKGVFWRTSTSKVTQYIEQARFGGRQEVFRWKHEGDVYSYDLEKAYLNMLGSPMPTGSPARLIRLRSNNYTLCNCTVELPPGQVGLLPMSQDGKVIWYTDSIVTGTWYKPELEFALAMGAKIKEVHEYVLFHHREVFKPLSQRILQAIEEKPEYKKILKLLGNIIVGKLAQRRTYPRYHHQPKNLGRGMYCYDMDAGIYYQESKPQKPPWFFPQAQGMVTALCRVELGRALHSHSSSLLACHTDGFMCSQPWQGVEHHKLWKVDQKHTKKNASWTSLFPACFSLRTNKENLSQGPLYGEHEPGEQKTITRRTLTGERRFRLDVPDKPLFETRLWFPDGSTRPKHTGA